MTMSIESSRRAFLATLAAGGTAAAFLPGVADAQADVGSATAEGLGSASADSTQRMHTEAYPAPTPGTHYAFFPGADFFPLDSTVVYSKSQGQIESTAPGGGFYFPLDFLPLGARVTEITFAVVKSASYTGSAELYAYRIGSGGFAPLDHQTTATLTQQPVEQLVSMAIDGSSNWVVDNEQAIEMWLVAGLSSSRVNSVRVGWTVSAGPLSFYPLDPKRVYDSRSIAPVGPLPNLGSRVISVANGYSAASTVDLPDVVPAGAVAIAYNLTIANTVGSGFLSVNPGSATSPGGSSINWFQSGMTLANGLVVKLDGSRQINVFCGGGGSTDFIIDVLGYYR